MNGNAILLVLPVGATVTDCGAIAEILLSCHCGRMRRLEPRIHAYMPVADLLQPVQPEIADSRGCRVLSQVVSRAAEESLKSGRTADLSDPK
jgi:hypothetical protein